MILQLPIPAGWQERDAKGWRLARSPDGETIILVGTCVPWRDDLVATVGHARQPGTRIARRAVESRVSASGWPVVLVEVMLTNGKGAVVGSGSPRSTASTTRPRSPRRGVGHPVAILGEQRLQVLLLEFGDRELARLREWAARRLRARAVPGLREGPRAA